MDDHSQSQQNSLKPYPSKTLGMNNRSAMERVNRIASENGVVIFSKSSCCLCYTVSVLFQELGVTPREHNVDQDPEGWDMEKAIADMGCKPPVPAIFIGGRLIGSTNDVMTLHLSGSLIPMLRPYQSSIN